MKLEPKLKPFLTSEIGVDNFEPFFTSQNPNNTTDLTPIVNLTKEFTDFDYVKPDESQYFIHEGK